MKYNYTVISTPNNYYLYDGVSSNIFSIEPSLFLNHKHLFQNIYSNNYEVDKQFANEYSQIIEAINNKLLVPVNENRLLYWFETEEYQKNFLDQITHLMISVTEKCNMRCKYCIYSGHYENERIHGEKDIDFLTLKNSLEKFFSISGSNNKIVNFYGGEPFVNYNSIKTAVEYINKIDSNTQIFITTNGVLLNEEICEWFSNNKNVHLYVSFAGTPEIHDKLRVFSNENPTYTIIKENLLRIKNYDKESYIRRMHFIFNIYSELQLIDVQNFWEEEELFKDNVRLPEISFIDCADDDGFVRKLGDEIINFYNNKYKINLLDRYIELLISKQYNNVIVKHFDEKFLNIHRRPDNHNTIISGVCKPFIKKIFIDVHGNINVCENFTYGSNFGNINDNFYFENTIKLLDTYRSEREKTCRNCWASKMCSLCFRDLIDKDGTINQSRSDFLCDNERSSILQTLSEYCTILEKDSSLLDHLNDYIVHF